LALGALVLALLLLAWAFWPSGSTPDAQRARGAVVAVPPPAPGDSEGDCVALRERLGLEVAQLEPLGALELEAGLAQGQARRVAGEARRWPHDVDPIDREPELRQALETFAAGLRITGLHCDEPPCLVGLASRTGDPMSSDAWTAALEALPERDVLWDWSPGGLDSDEVYVVLGRPGGVVDGSRMYWRARRAANGRPLDPPLPPEVAAPVAADPCGPVVQAARQRIADHAARATRLRIAIERGWAVLEELEGQVQPLPEGFEPREHARRAAAIASRLGVTIESLECDEAPCLVELRAGVPPGTAEEDVRARMGEALAAEGYKTVFPMVLVYEDPDGVYAYGPLTPVGETASFTRVFARMADKMRELVVSEAPPSDLDWTVPLPPAPKP
jgi:hypothetical protein